MKQSPSRTKLLPLNKCYRHKTIIERSMNLKKLHEAFIEKANRPMTFGALPIDPCERTSPIIAVERWQKVDGSLTKRYEFRRENDRGRFVLGLLNYEQEVKHNATIVIEPGAVTIRVMTHDVGHVTELDKEYATFADVLFRDVVYDPDHGTSQKDHDE